MSSVTRKLLEYRSTKRHKKSWSKAAWLSCAAGVIGVPVSVWLAWRLTSPLYVISVVFYGTLAISFCAGGAAIIDINHSDGRLRGWLLAVFGLIGSIAWLAYGSLYALLQISG